MNLWLKLRREIKKTLNSWLKLQREVKKTLNSCLKLRRNQENDETSVNNLRKLNSTKTHCDYVVITCMEGKIFLKLWMPFAKQSAPARSKNTHPSAKQTNNSLVFFLRTKQTRRVKLIVIFMPVKRKYKFNL